MFAHWFKAIFSKSQVLIPAHKEKNNRGLPVQVINQMGGVMRMLIGPYQKIQTQGN
jgi:hypothetical protein